MKRIKVAHIWRGIYRAGGELYRRINGVWTSGEAYPQGVYSSPLRQAPPATAKALDEYADTQNET